MRASLERPQRSQMPSAPNNGSHLQTLAATPQEFGKLQNYIFLVITPNDNFVENQICKAA